MGRDGVVARNAVGGSVQIRQGGIGGALDDDGGLAVLCVTVQGEYRILDSAVGIGGANLLPGPGGNILHIHGGSVGVIGAGGDTVPAYLNPVAGISIGYVNYILNIARSIVIGNILHSFEQ